MDIKNDKVWIFYNSTEHDIAADLVEVGVLKQDIVLGFYPPFLRELSNHVVSEKKVTLINQVLKFINLKPPRLRKQHQICPKFNRNQYRFWWIPYKNADVVGTLNSYD